MAVQRPPRHPGPMKPVLRRLHSPDVHDLVRFAPTDPSDFGFLLQIFAGPEGEEGEESFDVVVCSPGWISRQLEAGPLSGRHHLFVAVYDHEKLLAFVRTVLDQCEGETWRDVAQAVGRFAKWEFEDYVG
jgi:hypothetical protein